MNRAASAMLLVLVSCAGDQAAEEPSAGTNPPMLWLGMSSSSAMQLVGEEPRPY